MSIDHWQYKLAAWTHDPAEKALILLRDRSGHEGGTVKALQQEIFGGSLSSEIKSIMKKADHWAAAADRPNFPSQTYYSEKEDKDKITDRWSTVRFYNKPVLIHPLSGEQYNFASIVDDVGIDAIKAVSFDHFMKLIQRDTTGSVDHKKTALAFWRFGPALGAKGMEMLWQMLPADTRVPDHTIWSHLDLTSAFASTMAQSTDEQPALLSMSFGPVQDFIAQARSTSDLWAGSHLLSRIVWEGLKVICDRVGPDAVIFPQLRNVALVDVWLQNEVDLPSELFNKEEWREATTDTNPLYSAALPNKFMALVPASMAGEIAKEVTSRVRDWVQSEGAAMLKMLLNSANIEDIENLPCWQQLTEQLTGFPEVHWAAVPWSLVSRDSADKADPEQTQLKKLLSSFIPEGDTFLDSNVWKLLSKEIQLEGAAFHVPNPGLLYPALYDLLDRLAASAKVARPFKQLKQQGYRCTITGEHEWLTTDREHLGIPPTKRKDADTLWNRVARSGRFGVKAGEHLGGIGMLKRLWPRRFSQWVEEQTGQSVNRFIVSTHALAMASSLEKLAEGKTVSAALASQAKNVDGVVLPRHLVNKLHKQKGDALAVAKGIPALMDMAKESADEKLSELIQRELEKLSGHKPEAYFAMLYMDGDKMGAWLADSWDNDDKGNHNRLQYKETWHPFVSNSLLQKFTKSANELTYPEHYRPISPARHMAISSALNSFALHIARHVVEDCYMGKLLYAGGDDVMAMVSVKDLLPCMFALRLAYSGVWPEKPTAESGALLNLRSLRIGGGHVLLRKNLHRVMGHKATASVGAVIAHHTAPLAMVLRELRTAERESKHAGRDAFALRVLKRGGGAEHLSLPWLLRDQKWNAVPELENTSMGLLMALRDQLTKQGEMSRRVAYIINTWLPQLPDYSQFKSSDKGNSPEEFKRMIETLLAAQLNRQSKSGGSKDDVAASLMRLADNGKPEQLKDRLRNIFATAEFFARNDRAQGGQS